MKLDKKSTVSLYIQLMHVIKEQIHNGTYLEGEQIPTEGELSKMYNISRITIRRAIEELCQQGYLKKIQGKGTFVEAPKIYRKLEQDNNISFTEACKLKGSIFCGTCSHNDNTATASTGLCDRTKRYDCCWNKCRVCAV